MVFCRTFSGTKLATACPTWNKILATLNTFFYFFCFSTFIII
nr:MAG TPA: hypothetical protein [Caudoviricetes sp.]